MRVVNPPAAEAAAAPPSPSSDQLDRSLIQGIAWTSAVKWGSQIVTWAVTLIVARILTPEDYGLVGMAAIYLGLVKLLSEFGLGTAVVTLRELSTRQVAQINGLALLIGVGSFGLSLLAAPALGRFFNAPQLPFVVVVMSLAFLVTAFRIVPHALLQRELRFKLLALMEGVEALVAATSTLLLAFFGFGYWALVLGPFLGVIVLTALTVFARPHWFAWPRRQALTNALTFSRHALVGALSWYMYSTADHVIIGRVLGQGALGLYAFGWTLAGVTVEKITALVGRVTPGFFSAVQTDLAALRRYLLTLTEGISMLTFPVALGLTLVAEDFVLLALGEKWAEMIPVLQLLAVFSAYRSITPLLVPVLNVRRETRFTMYNNLLALLVLPPAFYVGSRWGIEGIATTWIVMLPLIYLPLYHRVFSRIELSTGRYLRALWPALSSSLLMGAAVLALSRTLPPGMALALQLGLKVALGAAVYCLAMVVLHRERLRAFYRVLKQARG
ncbi:MAG: lipopolysaccharide biosynthesis protein [Gemmatimonadetes bacterium]|nr:lipopolysaccharide biosynthesis protein [Gemmatimonadota bacterium]